MFNRRVLTVACALLVCLALVSQAQPPNLALNGTATQSSEYGGFPASNAINGNTGDFTHNAADDPDMWLEVDLGVDGDLSRIIVYNRASCCGERLVGAVLKVLDADRNEIYVSEPVAEAVTGDAHTYDNDGAGFTAVRFIRWEGGTDFVSLGEIQALGFYPFAYGPTPAVGTEDVADTTSLQWEAADGAASYKVYVSADAIIDEADLAGEVTETQLQPAEALTPGTLYSWRVDAIDAGGAVSEGPVWTFTTLGWEAHYPSPSDGASNFFAEGVTLSWTVGKDAILHNVYFGTDEALVAARDGTTSIRAMSLSNTVDLDALDVDSTYYWAVDEWASSGIVYPGPVWSFSTIPTIAPIDDESLVGWWTFDTESNGSATVLDMTGNGRHGLLVGDITFEIDPDMGAVLSLPGGSNQYVAIGEVGISDIMPRTIACWAKADHTNIPDWTLIFGFTTTGGGSGSHFNIGSLGGPGGTGAHVWGWEETMFSDQDALEWHHYAMTYDGTTIAYYGDGVPMDSDPGKSNVQDLAIMGDNVQIGSRITQDSSFPGDVDDCRVYDRVLTTLEIRTVVGVAEMAYAPVPADGAVDLPASGVVLTWIPGEGAAEQDVYLGSNEAAVAAADATDETGIYLGRQADIELALDELDRGITYFWKVSGVTADGAEMPAGPVWSFRIDDANTKSWASVAATAEPGFQATFVANGTYDIGDFSGDITYEFVVISNPDETQASMALMGQMFANKAGIKYEQWNNTGTYGATLFGVVDLDFGVPTAPGEYTHLAFVSSEDAATTTLYVNGEEAGSVDRAVTMNGTVGIGRAIREDGTFVDDFDGTIFAVAVYDKALDAGIIAKNATAYFQPIPIKDPDLLIHYTFETGEGTIVTDQSGHGNSAEFFGTPEWVDGVEGGGLAIVLEDVDYIQTKAPLGITSNTVTACGWAYHDETPAAWSGILTHRSDGGGNLGLQHNGMETGAAELRYMWGPDLYWDFSSGLLIPNGEWYFAALAIAPDQAKFYLNGTELTATNVAAHDPVAFDDLIRVGRDHQDSRIMTSTLDDVRFYNKTLTDVEILGVMLGLEDVTAAGDEIVGVPNDGDWPDGEYPALAIDDNSGTKFLHRKGGAMATGIQVAPAVGPTVVTALALTTANDSPTRDPISFELSGSNESIDGPYELIAAGDIVDFAGETEWPRFAKNATPILFENEVGYAYYQIVFPMLRGETEGLMQIAEIELLGELAPLYAEDFESFEVGTDLHNVDGWEGWEGTASAGAPVSDAMAFSGSNSVEIVSTADLIKILDITGGAITLSAMQYVPSGTEGDTFFILMNQYATTPMDWSPQTKFSLGSGQINDGQGTIIYDEWVELMFNIDLDGNTVDVYYNGELLSSGQWDDTGHNTLQAIDLYSAGASSVYYDDIVISSL